MIRRQSGGHLACAKRRRSSRALRSSFEAHWVLRHESLCRRAGQQPQCASDGVQKEVLGWDSPNSGGVLNSCLTCRENTTLRRRHKRTDLCDDARRSPAAQTLAAPKHPIHTKEEHIRNFFCQDWRERVAGDAAANS